MTTIAAWEAPKNLSIPDAGVDVTEALWRYLSFSRPAFLFLFLMLI